jgi:hypothetical protein
VYHTAETLEGSLLAFVRADALGRNIVIVDTADDLTDAIDIISAYDDTAVAWARDGKAYLIADRIAVGTERGVFLHEVGSHLGLERILTPAEFSRLVGKIVSWASKNDGSVESKLAKLATDRVNAAGTEGANARMSELRALGQALKDAPLKKPFGEMRGDDFTITELLGPSGYRKYNDQASTCSCKTSATYARGALHKRWLRLSTWSWLAHRPLAKATSTPPTSRSETTSGWTGRSRWTNSRVGRGRF